MERRGGAGRAVLGKTGPNCCPLSVCVSAVCGGEAVCWWGSVGCGQSAAEHYSGVVSGEGGPPLPGPE